MERFIVCDEVIEQETALFEGVVKTLGRNAEFLCRIFYAEENKFQLAFISYFRRHGISSKLFASGRFPYMIDSTCRVDFPFGFCRMPAPLGILPKHHSYGILLSDKGDEEEEYAARGAAERGWRLRIPAPGSRRSLRSFRAETRDALRRRVRRCGRAGGVMPLSRGKGRFLAGS